MGTNELNAKVKELRELQQLIEEATAEAEAIKDELKAYMTAANVEEMTVGLFTLRYRRAGIPRAGRSRRPLRMYPLSVFCVCIWHIPSCRCCRRSSAFGYT